MIRSCWIASAKPCCQEHQTQCHWRESYRLYLEECQIFQLYWCSMVQRYHSLPHSFGYDLSWHRRNLSHLAVASSRNHF